MAIPDWIHLSKTTGASEVFTNITITADVNTGTTSRSYTLTVTGGSPGDIASATIEVTQAPFTPYENRYLTFNITSPGNINWYQDRGPYQDYMIDGIEYRKNGGAWTIIPPVGKGETHTEAISVISGDILEFRGTNPTYTVYGGAYTYFMCYFSGCTAGFTVEGNTMSMIYGDDFENKTSITSYTQTYNWFFRGCTGLTDASCMVLPATSLTLNCYAGMFEDCTSLTGAPALPARTLSGSCYYSMFKGCTSLTTAPDLPAPKLVGGCYVGMFSACTSLSNIKCLALTGNTSNTENWTYGVASSGTFTQHQLANWSIGVNGIPTTWMAISNYSLMPMTFKIISGGTINWSHRRTLIDDVGDKTIEYRINDGNWTSITSSSAGSSFNVSTGDIVEFRGDNTRYGSLPLSYNTFSGTTATFEAYGNTMSLINSTGYTGVTDLTEQYAFNRLFAGCTGLTTAEYLVLPTTTLPMHVYSSMFEGCTSMGTAPVLPARTLTNSCYNEMFSGCNGLYRIRCFATDASAYNCTYNWVSNVASSGTFMKDPSMTGWGSGNSGVPSGWTTQDTQA